VSILGGNYCECKFKDQLPCVLCRSLSNCSPKFSAAECIACVQTHSSQWQLLKNMTVLQENSISIRPSGIFLSSSH